MRTLRLSLISAAIVALPLGWGPSALSQSEAPLDPMGASAWTGTWTSIGGQDGETSEDGGYTEILNSSGTATVTSSDPRIAGTWTAVQNVRITSSREPDDVPVGLAYG